MRGTIVVTGAARGIGAAIAERHAREGWGVVLADLDPDAVAATARDIGTRHGSEAVGVSADVTTADGRRIVCAAVRACPAPLRGLVNNAGITADALLTRMTEEQLRAVIRVNLSGAYDLTRELLASMDDGASIVNVSSKSASGNVGQFNYAVSKAGLLGLTRSLALELAPNVRVNAVAPAFIATEMTLAIPQELRERFVSRIPFGRPGDPREVADVVHWLTSEDASYVTGQVVPICGGRSFGP